VVDVGAALRAAAAPSPPPPQYRRRMQRADPRIVTTIRAARPPADRAPSPAVADDERSSTVGLA
jgi:hypothetical protein